MQSCPVFLPFFFFLNIFNTWLIESVDREPTDIEVYIIFNWLILIDKIVSIYGVHYVLEYVYTIEWQI